MGRCASLLFGIILIGSRPALSHDFWIEPSSFRPQKGDEVTASLLVGQHLMGEPVPRISEFIDRFDLKGAGVAVALTGERGEDPAGRVRISEVGPQWISYQSLPYPVTLDAAKFESYLREEGLEHVIEARAKSGQSAALGRERFYRCAKALLQASGGSKGAFDAPVGLTLELIPKNDPYALGASGELSLSLLFRGKAAANVLVVARSKADPEKTVSARTDAKGGVKLRLPQPGFWLVKAVHMAAAPAGSGADWESWWASISFASAGRKT
ncbi:MAG: DUF4198 domain-containing protein [Deltaproteobacteria bacterium]|nr:DUF4198 domain-containing protein [Deltaproteobacteria bacterium]